jgi:hypothetical protein
MQSCLQKTRQWSSNISCRAFNRRGAGLTAAVPPSNGASDGRPKGCGGNVSHVGGFADEKSGTLTTLLRGVHVRRC